MKVILTDLDPDDWILGVRAAKWLMDRFQKDAVISYGEGNAAKDIYVKRNKASITARQCHWRSPQVNASAESDNG
jgi:hypothetical protein